MLRDTIQFDLDASVARASFDELRSDNVYGEWLCWKDSQYLHIFIFMSLRVISLIVTLDGAKKSTSQKLSLIWNADDLILKIIDLEVIHPCAKKSSEANFAKRKLKNHPINLIVTYFFNYIRLWEVVMSPLNT